MPGGAPGVPGAPGAPGAPEGGPAMALRGGRVIPPGRPPLGFESPLRIDVIDDVFEGRCRIGKGGSVCRGPWGV